MNGAEAMVKCLAAEGITRIFGYPGVAISPFLDALNQDASIEHILVRQEQAAGHAASGYARHGDDSKRRAAKRLRRALKLARKASCVIFCCGLDEMAETEGLDRKTLALPAAQRRAPHRHRHASAGA